MTKPSLREEIEKILNEWGYETDRKHGEVTRAIFSAVKARVPKKEKDGINVSIGGFGSSVYDSESIRCYVRGYNQAIDDFIKGG